MKKLIILSIALLLLLCACGEKNPPPQLDINLNADEIERIVISDNKNTEYQTTYILDRSEDVSFFCDVFGDLTFSYKEPMTKRYESPKIDRRLRIVLKTDIEVIYENGNKTEFTLLDYRHIAVNDHVYETENGSLYDLFAESYDSKSDKNFRSIAAKLNNDLISSEYFGGAYVEYADQLIFCSILPEDEAKAEFGDVLGDTEVSFKQVNYSFGELVEEQENIYRKKFLYNRHTGKISYILLYGVGINLRSNSLVLYGWNKGSQLRNYVSDYTSIKNLEYRNSDNVYGDVPA